MYRHILIPTDGSEFSRKAVSVGVELAKLLGAKVTGVTVTIPWQSIPMPEIAVSIPVDEYNK